MDWNPVRKAIAEKDKVMYYAGGTLCIDFPGGVVGLNLDGGGFSSFGGREEKFDQPDDVKRMVRTLYIEVKGKTDHYKAEVQDAVSV